MRIEKKAAPELESFAAGSRRNEDKKGAHRRTELQCTTAENVESRTAQCVVDHGMCIPWILLSTNGDNCGRRREKERSSEDIWGCCTGFVGYR
jgi:hypothetical protein